MLEQYHQKTPSKSHTNSHGSEDNTNISKDEKPFDFRIKSWNDLDENLNEVDKVSQTWSLKKNEAPGDSTAKSSNKRISSKKMNFKNKIKFRKNSEIRDKDHGWKEKFMLNAPPLSEKGPRKKLSMIYNPQHTHNNINYNVRQSVERPADKSLITTFPLAAKNSIGLNYTSEKYIAGINSENTDRD